MLTAVVGINWGDEGKGRMVDLLSAKYNVICRYQGGNNAGHTVVNDKGRFILNLLPSGILRDNVVNVMGNGMVIDLEHLCGEINALKSKGVKISPDTLKISDKAFICMPWHKQQDILEEERLADKKYGSTRRGIAPVYGDKVMKKGIRMGDLLTRDTLEKKVAGVREWKRLILGGYGDGNISLESMMQWLIEFGKPLLPYICDISEYLLGAVNESRDILFEAQLGALRDIDYGIYPYTTSSQTLAAYAPIGAGIPGVKLDQVIGIMKAYSSCVGEGPFTAELFGEEASRLREAGAEYGAATGRPRRVGGFDIPASRYGVYVQGASTLALTKLDVLSYLDIIPVCIAYEIDGVRCDHFPTGDRLLRAKPIYEYLDGFRTDISKCRKPDDLPVAAIRYIRFIEKAVGCPIQYVSVGAGRDDYIEMR
ncbi:MAG: adenylosuccinate synthase [Clostridiaceae bacterium]|jgi:adenylosuccinate synthase|nr:adenylosuccinate synthase [Clostridiaceae bacterium]